MESEENEKNTLWPILVETVHAIIMYPHHKNYVRDIVLRETPNTSPRDLALKLDVPLGEAMVLLYELKKESV